MTTTQAHARVMGHPTTTYRACARLALVLGLLIPGMSDAAKADTASSAQQSAGAATLADTSRIVTVGGAVTETVYALGLADRIVAVDITSTFPPAALRTKKSVGYMRALSPEGVLSVDPSIIIATEGAGPHDAIAVLRAAAIPFLSVPEARDAAGVAANIRRIAGWLGVPDKGEEVAQAVEADFAALDALRMRIKTRRNAVFVLSAAGNAPMVGGAGSSADALLALAGVDNAMAGVSGFKPAADEAMIAAAPQAIVLMDTGSHPLDAATLSAMPAFAGSPAVAAGRLLQIDGSYALAFGPRAAHAARDIAAAVYPELGLPALPAHPWTTIAAQPRPVGQTP